jgi:hypothetical protein
MAPKNQVSYPRVINIKDPDIKETIRLLWDNHHSNASSITALQTALDAASKTIASQTADLTRLKTQMTQVAAGGGISATSSVGGGGSGGTSGGSGSGTPGGGTPPPPSPGPSDIPNQSGTVAQAKADLIAGGIDITSCTPGGDCCGPWQIINLAAFRLGGNYGLLSKSGGQQCNGMSTDIIAVKPSDGNPQMPIFDCLIDAGGANGPTWSFNSFVDTSRWVAPQTPPI